MGQVAVSRVVNDVIIRIRRRVDGEVGGGQRAGIKLGKDGVVQDDLVVAMLEIRDLVAIGRGIERCAEGKAINPGAAR